jgi:hypothetical protein
MPPATQNALSAPNDNAEDTAASITPAKATTKPNPKPMTCLLKQGGLTAYSLSQLEDWPEESWLIPNVMPSEEVMMVYGPSRIGKSFVVIDMAMSTATARPFAGTATERTSVLYIALEGSKGMPKRLKAWREHHGVAENEASIVVAKGTIDLFSDAGMKELVGFIRDLQRSCGLKFGLIIIDTLAKAMGRGKENDNSDVTVVTLNAQRLSEAFKATVLLVHHTGKSEDAGPRGGSALTCNVNASIAVTKGANGERFLELDKMKDEDDSLRFAFTLPVVELGQGKNGRMITSCVARVASVTPDAPDAEARLSAGASKLLNVIKAAGSEGFDWSDIGDHAEFAVQYAKRRATVNDWKAELLKRGEIRADGAGRKKRFYAVYPPVDESAFDAI